MGLDSVSPPDPGRGQGITGLAGLFWDGNEADAVRSQAIERFQQGDLVFVGGAAEGGARRWVVALGKGRCRHRPIVPCQLLKPHRA